MTQYRWIVVSVLAVFVLSALCTPSDADCTDQPSCRSCRGALLVDGASANCQWCSLFGNVDPTTPDDTPRLSYGFCVEQGECGAPDGSTSPNGIGFRFKALTRLLDKDDCTAINVNEAILAVGSTCAKCLTDNEGNANTNNAWCPVVQESDNTKKGGICSGTESCDNFILTPTGQFTFQTAVTSPDKCPTDDEKKNKASTAFSMFSGSAVGFISAVAISGFVM